MSQPSLGRLERVDLRTAWLSESGDFTPWLASEENISLLGDTIHLELEVEAQEKNVGPFRADILCKDTANDNWVLIENQLERTDHSHLGQLITYAAGLQAVTIVWIAERFTEEHRAALDWLNEATSEDINFFGLEVELWRIGNSPVAPKFNVVSSPNDWTRRVTQQRKEANLVDISPAKQLQLEFWAALHQYVEEHGASFKLTKPLPQYWMNIAIGRTGFKLLAICSLFDTRSGNYESNEVRAELEMNDDNAKDYYSQLIADRGIIEQQFGSPLSWYNPENKRVCRISTSLSGINLHDRSKWPEYLAWLVRQLDQLRTVFGSRVRSLSVTSAPEQI